MRKFLLASLAGSLICSACAHGGAASAVADAPPVVKPGKLVWQGHSPQVASAGSLVMLELELHEGEHVLATPTVITLPHTDAVVRQAFEMEHEGKTLTGSLDLTVRPAGVEGKRCNVLMKSSLSTDGASADMEHSRAVRTTAGKWVEILDQEPIQVRMRCSTTDLAHVSAPRVSSR